MREIKLSLTLRLYQQADA